jgi:DNA-binding response OmpR family regulator
VLEDDPAVQATLCTMLTLAGFTTHRAVTVDDALAILVREHVDACRSMYACPIRKAPLERGR